MPMPTRAAVIVEELDDDKLWAKLLVRCIKQIKDEDMKEDFKQHVNVIALQAVRGTWQVSNNLARHDAKHGYAVSRRCKV